MLLYTVRRGKSCGSHYCAEYLLGAKLEISLAKPHSYKKTKEEMLRSGQRMMQVTTESVAWPGSNNRWRARTVGMGHNDQS